MWVIVSPEIHAASAEDRDRYRHLIAERPFPRGALSSARGLDDQRGGRPQRAAGDDQEVAEQDLGIDIGCGTPIASATPAKLRARPPHCRRPQPFAEKQIGAERDEERRGVEKHHRARRRRKHQAAIDQHEFDAEDDARHQAGPQRAVALEEFHPAQPADRRACTGNAPTERISACSIGGTSGSTSFTAIWLNPQLRHSISIKAMAPGVSARPAEGYYLLGRHLILVAGLAPRCYYF